MNLLKDEFISTTSGKVSLKTILTSEQDYQLQYFFDEIQLAMLQLLSSLATVVLNPTIVELKGFLKEGVSEQQYDDALNKVSSEWFESDCFMQSKPPADAKWPEGPITKMLSGIECGTSPDAIGLFGEVDKAQVICPDCMHGLNYNLHMNIKGECFGPTGATGIRGGGAISTLIAGDDLKKTLLNNVIAHDYFNDYAQLNTNAINEPMWITAQAGSIYQAQNIGLVRGLFALAYHISFTVDETACCCDVCGSQSVQSVTMFNREKYKGHYGSTKNGRDAGAGWWPHPYTPRNIKEEGVYAVCARDQNWQSWQELGSYIVGKETDKAMVEPAYIVKQFKDVKYQRLTNLLIGGNIASKGSIKGRVYDLYSMPSSLSNNLSKITQVIDSGLEQKERLSHAFNKMFGVGYDKNFVGGIKSEAMSRFTANAQQIIQRTLLDVERKEATELRKAAVVDLKQEAKRIFMGVQRKYQHDLPLFKALIKGEVALYKK
jgi:CRISPR system Cascade subunit CasA